MDKAGFPNGSRCNTENSFAPGVNFLFLFNYFKNKILLNIKIAYSNIIVLWVNFKSDKLNNLFSILSGRPKILV